MARRSVWVVIVLGWAAPLLAQEIAVPVDVQIPLLLKVLTLDRNLKSRAGSDLVMGVVYQRKFRTSLNAKDEIMAVLEQESVRMSAGLPIRGVPIDLSEEADLTAAIERQHIDLLYITPIRTLGIETITRISRAKQVMTLTGVPDYVHSGLTVGVGIKGGRPHIIINVSAAKAEGVNFHSRLLKLATLVQD